MRILSKLALLGLTYLTTDKMFTYAKQQPFWEHNGDMCYKPKDLSNAKNVQINFCNNLVDVGTPCQLTFEQPVGAATLNYTIYIPQGIEYPSLDDPNLRVLHQEQQQGDNSNLLCNPCILPSGNYKESSINYKVTYLPKLHPTSPCLFQVDSDEHMRKMTVRKDNSDRNPNGIYHHNEALFATGLRFMDVKNYCGRIVTPSDALEVSRDICYESGSNATVAVYNESTFDHEKGLKAAMATAALGVVVTAALTLKSGPC